MEETIKSYARWGKCTKCNLTSYHTINSKCAICLEGKIIPLKENTKLIKLPYSEELTKDNNNA